MKATCKVWDDDRCVFVGTITCEATDEKTEYGQTVYKDVKTGKKYIRTRHHRKYMFTKI